MKKIEFISPTELVKSWEERTLDESEENDHIILNRIKTPDGTILTSRHRHDYVTHEDANGLEYMVDGGFEYLRRNVHKDHPYEELSITTEAPFEQIRESLCWGTYGKNGDQPIRYVQLNEMSNDHIKNILERNFGAEWIQKIFKRELTYRKKRKIVIND